MGKGFKSMKIQTNKIEVHALWTCIKKIIELGIPEEKDAAILLDAMTAIAKQAKETTKPYKVRFIDEHLIPCWTCLDIFLKEGMCKTKDEVAVLSSVMEKLAAEIDRPAKMSFPFLKLLK